MDVKELMLKLKNDGKIKIILDEIDELTDENYILRIRKSNFNIKDYECTGIFNNLQVSEATVRKYLKKIIKMGIKEVV